jgi:hypothetical protein
LLTSVKIRAAQIKAAFLADYLAAAEFRGEFGVEVMSGVVAQIRSQKNMNLGETGEASHQQS